MIAIAPHAEGCVLPVRVQPGARRPGVQGEQAGALKLAVSAPPQNGRANKAVEELLRNCLRIKRSQIDLLSGATSREKRYLIRGLTVAQLRQRLNEATSACE
jgi:uncharacterized protein (TIGR00251 family)